MRRNILVTPLAALLAMGASGVYASAQDLTSAVLAGTVTGPDGKGMPGVRIYLTSGVLLTPREGRTDANGNFRFSLLPPGRYNVTYSAEGFVSRRSEMHLVAGNVAAGSVRLRAMDVQGETVEISADIGNLIVADKTDTVVQTAFTTDRLEEIGGGRGITALQALTPGLDGSINSINGFSIRGGLQRGNKIMQDGQIVNDVLNGGYMDNGATLDDLIESVAIIQSPLNAKLGNTDGGIINIVTKRGGNLFTGSLRVGPSRGNGWGAKSLNYPDMFGVTQPGNTGNVSDDNWSRSWQWSITGPIVPNYLTFTMGGNINPMTFSESEWAQSALLDNWARYNGTNPQNARLGTFYLDNNPNSDYYGNQVRASDWGATNGPGTRAYGRTQVGSNSFSLYFQPHQNHNINYFYTQGYRDWNRNGAYNMGDADPLYGEFSTTRSWNISYKAIVGAAGVFDMRYGRSMSFRDQPKAGNTSVQVQMHRTMWNSSTMGTAAPNILGSMVNADGIDMDYMENYMSSGIIGGYWSQNFPRGGNATDSGWPAVSFDSVGVNLAGSNGSSVVSINANYQHMLEFKGQHIIDIGFNREAADAPAIPSAARLYASPVGQISKNLQASQIGLSDMMSLNPSGGLPGSTVRSPVGRYAGKYIVFDVTRSKISDLEPWLLLRPNYDGVMLNDGLLYNPSGSYGGSIHEQLGAGSYNYTLTNLPWLLERYNADGIDSGDIENPLTSAYLNDMWTISDRHSIMLGLRMDNMTLKDAARTVHSYTKLTPRFQYTFDIMGDQKNVVALTYGQFHQMAPLSLYWLFLKSKNGDTRQRLWTGDAVDPSKKERGYYLVELDDILNPANYGHTQYETLSGAMYGDVDKNFRPPTSTEVSVWFRHTFPNGGYIKVSYNSRTWADLYDLYPQGVTPTGEMHSSGQWPLVDVAEGSIFVHNNVRRLKAVLKNTDDFTREYNGLELQWDFPITRRIAFGGNYTFASFKDNQSEMSRSVTQIDGSDDYKTLQTTWWWDWYFNRAVYVNEAGTALATAAEIANGTAKVAWQGNGRETWAPMLQRTSEFALGYYLILNVSQGKARSNFSLRGRYTGPSVVYEMMGTASSGPRGIYTGLAVIPGYTSNPYATAPGDEPNSGTVGQIANHMQIPYAHYYTNGSFYNSLTYNLNVPIAKRLNWYINIDVNNVFNHIAKSTSAPVGTTTNSVRFFPIATNDAGTSTVVSQWFTAASNPTRVGHIFTGAALDYNSSRNRQLRSISMSTGIRF